MSSIITYHRRHRRRLLLLLLILFTTRVKLTYSTDSSSSHHHRTGDTKTPAAAVVRRNRRRCQRDQAAALLQLKRSFNTSAAWGPWSKPPCTLDSWRAGTDCCRGWEGVRCGSNADDDGRVTVLDLGECGLEIASGGGGLHPALFNLTSLRHLDLAWNNFNGSRLPAVGFERLTSLLHLNLSSTGFAGPVPGGIKRLSKLVSLDLSNKYFVHDQFDGYVSLASWLPDWSLVEPDLGSLVANLSNLRELYLGKMDLSGNKGVDWCSTFANSTPQLRVLSLPSCGLRRPICESLSRIHSLAVIDLPYNFMYGPIPESFADLPSLSVLILTYNELKGWFPQKILRNRNLTRVDIRYNLDVSGSLPNFSSDSILEHLLVSSTNFSGPIPSTISTIKSLKKLGVASAHFAQQLPSSIGELRSLHTLEVSGSGIVGGIPSWIQNLTSLVRLQISNCGLSGEIPSFIENLGNLTMLQLYNCNFSGTIPPQILNMTKLKILNLGSNNLFGTVELNSFLKLPGLVSLYLSNNKLTVVDEEENSSPLNTMESLGLASCNMSKFPNALKRMHFVSYLDLSCNQIHGSIPKWAWENWNDMLILNLSHNRINNLGFGSNLPRGISTLDLSFNLLEGPIPLLGNTLDFSNNRFSSIPNPSSHLNNILFLKASRNNLSGPIPPNICDARSLEVLDLSYNNLSGSIPSCLMEDLNSLAVLNLKANQLHGELPWNMKPNCSFEDLDLSDNRMEGQLPRSLAVCQDLQVVDIGNNQIRDTFPCWMSKLPKLQVLVLKQNKFFGTVGREDGTCEFPKLRILDLSSNSLFGTLPKEWFKAMKSMTDKSTDEALSLKPQHASTHEGSIYQFTTAITYKRFIVTFSKILRTLVVIDVSENSFHGGIPESIGSLVQLHGLNMSHNTLTGIIPSQFGALNQLESLDLASNYLSGEIPQELASLHFLSMLNLSYNELVGRIPESPQFLTFSNLSFMGNPGLCGLQVYVQCNNTATPNAPQLEEKSVDVVLFLLVGLGYGVGFAFSIVVTWGTCVRKKLQDICFICWKKVY